MEKNSKSTTPDFFSKRPFTDSRFNERLWIFMNKIWEDPAEYKILMARRMFNLNYALMKEWSVGSNKQYLTDGIMSNTAFLLSARSIADRYMYKKTFPRILICDDVMLHGRGIINLIEKFRRLIIARLAEYDITISETKLDSDLNKAIIVYVFVRNSDKGILFDENKYRLYELQTLPMNMLRELSQQISEFLLSCGVANTSYVISAKLPWYQIKDLISGEDGDSVEAFQYKGRQQHIFFRIPNQKVVETIRLFYPREDFPQTGVITSLPIIGDFTEEYFSILCRLTAQIMEQNVRYSQIAIYLRLENPELAKPKAQLLSFLYSILSMADFCRQKLSVEGRNLYRILASGDFSKIISNFDTGEIFRFEILDFFKSICMNNSSSDLLWSLLYTTAQNPIINLRKNRQLLYESEYRHICGPDKMERRKEYEDAEDIFYKIGMDAEYSAFQHVLTGTKYDGKEPGVDLISFQQYITIMKRNRASFEHSVGCMLGLMDSGLISMNMEDCSNINGLAVRTILKAGEMATFVLPRRFFIFIPALAAVESQYTRIGKYVIDVIGSFIDYLQKFCYKQGEYTDPKDKQLLRSLQEKKPLLLYLYSAGQNFQDWDIDLRNERKYLSDRYSQEEKELDYKEEMARKNHYLFAARRFIYQKYIQNDPGRRRQIDTIE